MNDVIARWCADEIRRLVDAGDWDELVDLAGLVDPLSIAVQGANAGFKRWPETVNEYPEGTAARSIWQVGYVLAIAIAAQTDGVVP